MLDRSSHLLDFAVPPSLRASSSPTKPVREHRLSLESKTLGSKESMSSIAEQDIPIYTNLSDALGGLGASLRSAERWNNLAEEYKKRYGKAPAYMVRAPGRVK